jgi:hypothetical protein
MTEDIFVPALVFGTFSWVVWVVFNTIRRYKVAKMQNEMHKRLLEKFSSGDQFLAFLQSEAGKKFLNSLTAEQTTPYGRILSATSTGAVLIFLGASILVLRGRVSGGQETFLVFGTVIVGIAIGFLASALTSYLLSKSWGLLNSRDARAS